MAFLICLASSHGLSSGTKRVGRGLDPSTQSLSEDIRWHTSLGEGTFLVLLGIRTAWKSDLSYTLAELVHGTVLRIPFEFLTSSDKRSG